MLNKFGLSRLLLWFNFIILIVGLTSGAVFFMTSKKSVTQLTETSISGLDRLSAKSSLLKSVAAIQSNIIATVAEQDKDSRDIRLEVISGLMSEADKFFKSCGTTCKELQSVFDNYEKNWQTIQTEKLAKNDLNGATQDTISKLSPLAESLIDKLDKELIETKKLTESNFNEAVEQNHKAQMAVAAIILFSNIFMLALGLFFRKSIIANFNKLTSRLNISSSHTFEMSQYLSKTSEDINRSTDNQSSAVQEIVASLDEINAMASKNAETADTALNCSNDTTTVVTNGQHAVTDMISIMDEINAVNKNMETFVSANNNQLEQIVNLINSINEKTKVINDIVFQTKLLSFNASVEAARAGEHGKGFAVVAEEVGGLAQMSGNAAKEISELVQSSLSQVKDIVDKSKENVTRIVNENSEKISLGGERANACGNVLNEIHHNVSTLNELLKTVVTATQEQKQGINEIGVGMRQVDGATQQNKTATENLKENSNELRNEASTLKELTQDIVFTIMGHSSESSSLLRTPTSSTNHSQDNHGDSEWDERKSA